MSRVKRVVRTAKRVAKGVKSRGGSSASVPKKKKSASKPAAKEGASDLAQQERVRRGKFAVVGGKPPVVK